MTSYPIDRMPREILDHEILSREKEQRLFRLLRRCKPGSPRFIAIRNHIVTHNLRLVALWASRCATERRPFDDRFSDGLMGLYRAIEKYDVDRGFRFSTYAWRYVWVRASRGFSRKGVRTVNVDSSRPNSVDRKGPTIATLAIADDETRVDEIDRWDSAETCLQAASPKERTILEAVYLGAMPVREVAEILGVSRERIYQIANRGIKQIRKRARLAGAA